MSQEGATELVNFVYGVFGEQCADILLAGLGEEPAQAGGKFSLREAEEGGGQEWEIEVVGDSLPCRSEPLVLAALLRILIGREDIPSPLPFQISEVLDELLRAGVVLTHGDADRIISKYATIFYNKRARGGDKADDAGGGVYSLVEAYVKGSVKEAGEIRPARASTSVKFDQGFIEGLRRDEVTLAGIRFGSLRRGRA